MVFCTEANDIRSVITPLGMSIILFLFLEVTRVCSQQLQFLKYSYLAAIFEISNTNS